jgi:uncharacterized membrane protein
MNLSALIFLLIFNVTGFLSAYFLHKKVKFFKSICGVVILVVFSFLSVIIHNFGGYFLGKLLELEEFEEPVFFFLAFISFAAAVYLLVIIIVTWILKLIKKK